MKRILLLSLTAVTLLLGGCTSPSTVMPMQNGVYTISKSAPTGFTPLGAIRKAAYEEVKEFAASKGKVAQIVSVNEVAAGFAKWPQVEVRFRLEDPQSMNTSSPMGTRKTTSIVYDANGNPIDMESTVTEEPNTDKYEELKKLGELKESGVLTEEEFQKEKNKILESN